MTTYVFVWDSIKIEQTKTYHTVITLYKHVTYGTLNSKYYPAYFNTSFLVYKYIQYIFIYFSMIDMI